MADDEDQRSRRNPPKKPRRRSSSGDDTGPPEQPPRIPPPPNAPSACDKEVQTVFQINADVTENLEFIIEQRSRLTGPHPRDSSAVGSGSVAGPSEAPGLPSSEAPRKPPEPKDVAMGAASSSAPTASGSQAKPINTACILAQRHQQSEFGSITVLPVEDQPHAATSGFAAPSASAWKGDKDSGCRCFCTCNWPIPKSSHHTSVDSASPSPVPRAKSQYSRPEPHPDSLKVEELPCDLEEDEPTVQRRKTFSSQGVNTMYTFLCKRQIQMHAPPPPTPPQHPARQPPKKQLDEPEEKMDEGNDGDSAP